jgi:hypothetical protein
MVIIWLMMVTMWLIYGFKKNGYYVVNINGYYMVNDG